MAVSLPILLTLRARLLFTGHLQARQGRKSLFRTTGRRPDDAEGQTIRRDPLVTEISRDQVSQSPLPTSPTELQAIQNLHLHLEAGKHDNIVYWIGYGNRLWRGHLSEPSSTESNLLSAFANA